MVKKQVIGKGTYIIATLMMIIGQLGIIPAFTEQVNAVAGDDPGVTIKATSPIPSEAQVDLAVTLTGSAGKLDKDGIVNVAIPKSIVQDASQLASQIIIGDPFTLDSANPYTDDGNGNYILNVKYDHTKIDQSQATGYTFKVRFRAPYFETHEAVPEKVDFTAKLNVDGNTLSQDKVTSDTTPTYKGAPAFMKYSALPYKTINGEKNYLVDPTPNTENNMFIVIVNYNHQSYDDVTVKDQLPANMTLHDGYPFLTDVTSGDTTPVNHVNIYKVDQWGTDGTPKHYKYVTSEMANSISTTDTSLAVHLGKITSDDAYVITYGSTIEPGITPSDFGTRYNDAKEFDKDAQINQDKVPLIMDDSKYQAVSLDKKVTQKTLATKNGEITYSLELASSSDKVPAGTIITDPLPAHTTFDKTTTYDASAIEPQSYDAASNTMSYKLLKDINAGEKTKVEFSVKYDDPSASAGDKIVNRASINYAGSTIYSNDATTTLDGSAYLYKVDNTTNNPLAGAVFKIEDASGKTVKDNLTSDEKGFINSGLLDSGAYNFIETKAPANYTLDKKAIPFNVTAGQETPVNLTATNKLTPGSVELTKTDAKTGDALAKATFDLQKANGEVVQKDLTTGTDGKVKVDNLAPADYQFVETKAPTGYTLDTTPQKFTIEKGQSKAVEVAMTNTLTPGSVELTKTDAKTGDALTGATFDLQKANGEVVQKDLTTGADGKVKVDNLAPADYQFVETKAPENYQLDQTPQKFTIKAGQSKAVEVAMTNTLTPGSVELTKTAADTKAALAGATFDLQTTDGKVVKGNLVTASDGKIKVDKLAPGTYQFVETKAPENYQLDPTPQKFTIEKGQTKPVEVSAVNELTSGSVTLTKVDADTKAALAGAVFALQDSKGTELQAGLTTDQAGKLTLSDLAPGNYQFVETKAPTGYQLATKPVAFTVKKGQTKAVEVEVANTLSTGGVTLTKIDAADNKKVLAGAVFELQDDAGKSLQSGLTTDEAGKLAINDLKPGSYQFVETTAPKGYEISKTPVKFTIEKGQTQAVQKTMTNAVKPGSAILTKVDKETKEALAGAVFEVKTSAGQTIQRGLLTDKTGKVAAENLQPGSYQFIETKAPAGYDLDATPVDFTVEAGQEKAVEVEKTNTLKPGGVVLTKVDSKTGAELSDATFELQTKAGEVVQAGLTTDAAGKLAINDLKPGAYQLVETKAPTGYTLDKKPVEFTIEKGQQQAVEIQKANTLTPGGDILTKIDADTGKVLAGAVFELQDETGKALQSGLVTGEDGKIAVNDLTPGNYQFVETSAPTGYEIDKTPVKFTIESNQKKVVEETVSNKVMPGGVVLTKTDSATGKALAGATFDLQNQTGETLERAVTTGEDGKLAINDLKPGNYQLVESKAPAGYTLDQTPVKFTIEKGQKAAVQVGMTNTLTPGSVVLTKTDAKSGKTLAGAAFTLQDEAGKTLKSDLTTDAAGKLAVNDLTPGNYQLIESKAPTGYDRDQTPVKFTIEKNQKSAIQLTKTNQPTVGSVVLDKIDEMTGKKLAGAEFELKDQAGKVILKKATTDENGKLAINDLTPGNYQLIETQAPKGYELDATPINFEVKDHQKTQQELTKTNKEKAKTVRLEKRDSATNKVLKDAKFSLLDATGKMVQENLVTDQNGVIELANLKIGAYQLVETQAPTGYELDKAPVAFKLAQDSNLITLTKLNTKTPEPKTPKVPHTPTPSTDVPNIPNTPTTTPSTDVPNIPNTPTTTPSTDVPNIPNTPTTVPNIDVPDVPITTPSITTTPSHTATPTQESASVTPSESTTYPVTGTNSVQPNAGMTDQSQATDNPHSYYPKTGEKKSGWLTIVGILLLAIVGWYGYKKRATA